MSFVSILKKIGSVILNVVTPLEKVAAPLAETFLPAFAPEIAMGDALWQKLTTAIATAELQNPVDGQGQVKATVVQADFQASVDFMNSLLSATGSKTVYDPAKFQAAVAAIVSAYNAVAALHATIQTVPAPAAPAAG